MLNSKRKHRGKLQEGKWCIHEPDSVQRVTHTQLSSRLKTEGSSCVHLLIWDQFPQSNIRMHFKN